MPWGNEPVTILLSNLRTLNEANASQREHWATKHRRAKLQRSTTYRWLRHLLPLIPPPLPLDVTLTRIAPKALDPHDGLPSSLKHIVDGVADYLAGQYEGGEDSQPGLTWRYAQRRGQPKEYAVEITLSVPKSPHASTARTS